MKKLWTVPISSHQGTQKAAQRIYEDHLKNCPRFTVFLEGSLGAGKTYLVRELLKCFEIEESVSSPTYSILQEYKSPSGRRFAHFDFYRLKGEEFFQRGFADLLEDPGVSCFGEWPDRLDPLAKSTFLGTYFVIQMEHGLGVGMRKITLLTRETPL